MKRFQECNWLVKLWRYRWYTLVPFKYFWFKYIISFIVRETNLNEDKGCIEDTGEIYNPRGKMLWRLLIGIAQSDMNWTYTHEEVIGRLDKHFKD